MAQFSIQTNPTVDKCVCFSVVADHNFVIIQYIISVDLSVMVCATDGNPGGKSTASLCHVYHGISWRGGIQPAAME